MKSKYFWIFVITAGAILMIIGGAIGSEFYAKLLEELIDGGLIGPEFVTLVSSIINIIGFIASYGGYSVLVAVFLILGLLIYGVSWTVGYFNIALSSTWTTILTEVHALFTYQSGLALTGTAVVVVGKFLLKRSEKAYEEKAEEAIETDEREEASSNNPGSKFCPECGASLPAKANFCNKCGKNFD